MDPLKVAFLLGEDRVQPDLLWFGQGSTLQAVSALTSQSLIFIFVVLGE